MSLTRAQIKTIVNSLFIDNITEEISPEDGRDAFEAVVDNLLNLQDDVDLLGLKVHKSGRTYNVGDTYAYNTGIYRVTAAHTGGASPDFTKATIIANLSTSAIPDYVPAQEVSANQVFNFGGTLIRVKPATPSQISNDPTNEAFWDFILFKDQNTAISSGALNFEGEKLNAKNLNVTITGDITLTFTNLNKSGVYKVTIANTTGTHTITFAQTCTNMYTGDALTSVSIPNGETVLYVSKTANQYQIGGRVISLNNLVSNEAYSVTWLGIANVSPSKNALYTKIEALKAEMQNQIDNAIQGIKWKDPVKIYIPDEPIDLAEVFDSYLGVTIDEEDRVALGGQFPASENGIYRKDDTGHLVRSLDADTGTELALAQFSVLEGAFADRIYGVNNSVINLGVDAVNITQRFSNALPTATVAVEGKAAGLSDAEVDSVLSTDTSLPSFSAKFLSLRGLKRSLNWVVDYIQGFDITIESTPFVRKIKKDGDVIAAYPRHYAFQLGADLTIPISEDCEYVFVVWNPTGTTKRVYGDTTGPDNVIINGAAYIDVQPGQAAFISSGAAGSYIYIAVMGSFGGGGPSGPVTEVVDNEGNPIFDGLNGYIMQTSGLPIVDVQAIEGMLALKDGTTGALLGLNTELVTSNKQVRFPDGGDLATEDYVDNALSGKQNTLTFDSTPTSGSTNPVRSNGIYSAINAAIEGVKYKEDVKYATTENIALSGLISVDGSIVSAGDRILVKSQVAESQNGIYIAAVEAWSRSPDANTGQELQGAVVSVANGSTNANTTWRQTTSPVTIGANNLFWVQLGASTPDGSSTTKGKVKLYNSTGTNIDGAMDQNSTTLALGAFMAKANNLSDVANASTSRGNIGAYAPHSHGQIFTNGAAGGNQSVLANVRQATPIQGHNKYITKFGVNVTSVSTPTKMSAAIVEVDPATMIETIVVQDTAEITITATGISYINFPATLLSAGKIYAVVYVFDQNITLQRNTSSYLPFIHGNTGTTGGWTGGYTVNFNYATTLTAGAWNNGGTCQIQCYWDQI